MNKYIVLTLQAFLLAITMTFLPACSEDEDDCLVQGENCTVDYKEANYPGQDIQCCDSMRCESGQSSGVLICQY